MDKRVALNNQRWTRWGKTWVENLFTKRIEMVNNLPAVVIDNGTG